MALALAGYKLPGFRFDRIILGTIAPRVGGVSFQVAGGVRGGLKHFQIQGMVRVVMKPLINQMPLVGGLQIFFLNSPHVDFNLVGVADVLDMPGLSDMLRKIIVEQIGAIMVLPNKLPITLNSDVLASTLKMPEPEVRMQRGLRYVYTVLIVFCCTGCDAHPCDRGQGSDEEGHWHAGQGQIGSVRPGVGGRADVPHGDHRQHRESEVGLLVRGELKRCAGRWPQPIVCRVFAVAGLIACVCISILFLVPLCCFVPVFVCSWFV